MEVSGDKGIKACCNEVFVSGKFFIRLKNSILKAMAAVRLIWNVHSQDRAGRKQHSQDANHIFHCFLHGLNGIG